MEKLRLVSIENIITKSITETFDSMLSMDLTKVGKVTDEGLDDMRMVGVVHYAGEVIGNISLHVSRAFAAIITASMLGVDAETLDGDEEIKDVLGELTNIVSGNLKSDFLNAKLTCVISTPSITRGSDFKIESSKVGITHQWVFRHQNHEILIDIAIEEDLGAKVNLAGMEDLGADEIIEKINSVDIPTTVINSVIDVFYTMLSMEIQSIQEVPPDFREDKRTVGTVSFAGDVHGMFNIQVNDNFARTMTAAMLGMTEDEIESDEEVYDVIREMSNIIGGNLKSSFVDVGLSCVLSTPAITNGLDFRVESLNIIKTQRFLFNFDGHTIIIDAGIKKDGQIEGEGDAPDEKSSMDGMGDEALDEQADPYPNLDLILDIPLKVTVELGRTKKRIHELLKTGKGSVIGLQQLEGEPVNLLVNNMLIAKGEVLVEKEKYGIRIVEVVSRLERVKSFN
jgi:flagellar motor switch protein FliN